MKRTLLTVGVLLAVWTAGATTFLAQSPTEPDFNAPVAKSPAELRNGVATKDQVAAFLGVDDSELHGEPVWEIREFDLTLDGVKDLLISNHVNKADSGEDIYAVFIGSAKGFRYVGNFQGDIRTLPVESGKPVRFLIASVSADDKMKIDLVELQPAGLHRVARAEMVTQGCDAQDNPTFTELVCAEKISVETVKKVFGAKAL
jgi:hypothetical protein